MGRDNNHIDDSFLVGFCQLIVSKKYILIVSQCGFQKLHIISAICIRVGIDESEENTLNLLRKEKIEFQYKLFLVV